MASIDKLSIRGIRSFSPDEEDQIIQFSFPLTIIVGQNGCGKTTIIECLRYAVTGGLPPGNKSGQAFVHDPKHSRSSVVKGSVKLRFTNLNGKKTVVHRTMELSQKKATMTFKTLDGVIRTTDDTGKQVSIAHTCSELDRVIPTMLGVSKAVLDNVVFCHQEDSSWPLQEGAVLKAKFDAIFDSTKYAKALEAIKETKKRYANKVKDMKADLNLLAGHKHAAANFRREFEEGNESLSNVMDEIQSLNQHIDDERKLQAAKSEILDEKRRMEADVQKLMSDIEKELVRIETLRKTLKKDMTHLPRSELNNLLESFDNDLDKTRRRLKEEERKMQQLFETSQTLSHRKMELTQRKGVLLGEKSIYDNDLKRRIDIITQIHDQYDLRYEQSQGHLNINEFGTQASVGRSIFSQGSETTFGRVSMLSQESTPTISDEDLTLFQRTITMKQDEMTLELAALKKQHQKEDDEFLASMSEYTAKVKEMESALQRINTERDNAMKEVQFLKGTSSYNRLNKNDVETAREEMEKAVKAREDAIHNNLRTEIPIRIKEAYEKMEQLKHDIDEDQRSLKELRQSAEGQREVDILNRQIIHDMDSLISLKEEYNVQLHSHDFQVTIEQDMSHELLIHTSKTLNDKVSKTAGSMGADLKVARGKLKDSESRLAQSSALLNHNMKLLLEKKEQRHVLQSETRGVYQIKDVQQRLRLYEESMLNPDILSPDAEPQDILAFITQRIADQSINEDTPESVSRTIKKLKWLGKKKNYCPCCERDMDSKTFSVFNARMDALANIESSDIIMEDRARYEKGRLANIDYAKWRAIVSHNMNDWYDWKRLAAEIETMEGVVNKCKQDNLILLEAVNMAKEHEQKLSNDLLELQQIQEFSRRFFDEVLKITSKMDQVAKKMAQLSLSAPTAGGRNLDSLEMDISIKMKSRDDLSAQVTDWNEKLSSINNDVNKCTNAAAKAESNLRDMEEKFRKDQEMSDKRRQLDVTIMKCKDDERKIDGQLGPMRQKVAAKESERLSRRSLAEGEENQKSLSIENFKSLRSKFDEISSSINKFVQSKKLESLTSIETEMDRISHEEEQCQKTITVISPEIQKLKSQLNDHDGERTNVESNLNILHVLDSIKVLERERNRHESELVSNIEYQSAERDYSQSLQKVRALTSEKDRREGNAENYKSQLRELKRKLQTPEYDDIDERHRVKMIESEVCSLAVSDLEKYYNALDKAVLRYHGMKIAEINKIIQELWVTTYKGEDITSIRITSDQEEGSKASRSYNYRVVMSKGSTELDMRGRCSAGQRVLASIVIRLALAETFCLSCGVMALDEPTTNLDYENKRALAGAISQLIATRAAQSNFQLIIITHDEEFVSRLKVDLATHSGLNMPEKYFQVSRSLSADGCYYSKIHCIDWDEL